MRIKAYYALVIGVAFFSIVQTGFSQDTLVKTLDLIPGTNSNVISTEPVLVHEEIEFLSYLLGNGEYANVISQAAELNLNSIQNQNQKDSILYMAGWAGYHRKKLQYSNEQFKLIQSSSIYFTKAKFYESFNNAYLGYHEAAIEILKSELIDSILNPNERSLKYFELSGTALLKRDFDLFDNLSSQLDTSYFALKEEQKAMLDHYSDLKAIKQKSPLVAGLMSAVIPGSGKFYAGYRGLAISAAIPTVLFGVVAAENLVKGGPTSPQFIAFAALFSAFYVGNIWGSVLSVKIYKDEKYDEIDHSIIVDMHIPLRRIFNK